MVGNYFYNETVRKTVIAFGTLFNNISIKKFANDGKTIRMMNNGLNNQDDSNLIKKEKKDFELLKTKEAKSDLFGPLTNKETERLQNLSIKREKDKDANY